MPESQSEVVTFVRPFGLVTAGRFLLIDKYVHCALSEWQLRRARFADSIVIILLLW